MGIFPTGYELSLPFAEAHLRLPTESLEPFGELFQLSLQGTADCGRITIRPGAFHQGPAGMRIAGLGEVSLTAPRTTGIYRRGEPKITHELSGMLKTGEVSQCRDRCHRARQHRLELPCDGMFTSSRQCPPLVATLPPGLFLLPSAPWPLAGATATRRSTV